MARLTFLFARSAARSGGPRPHWGVRRGRTSTLRRDMEIGARVDPSGQSPSVEILDSCPACREVAVRLLRDDILEQSRALGRIRGTGRGERNLESARHPLLDGPILCVSRPVISTKSGVRRGKHGGPQGQCDSREHPIPAKRGTYPPPWRSPPHSIPRACYFFAAPCPYFSSSFSSSPDRRSPSMYSSSRGLRSEPFRIATP